jgi:alpha-galactosidase
VWLHGASPRVTYLSDLRPSGHRHIPFLDQKWDYRLDRNVLGGQLRAGGRLAAKGVGQHSTSLVSWHVPAGALRFAAQVGLDDAAAGGGSVVFRVFLDGKEAASSGIVRGGEPPREMTVELHAAKTISLVVDFADRGDVLDRADWLEARFER